MSTVKKIVKKLGGVKRTAELAECSTNWVYRWNLPKSRGGMGGKVPDAVVVRLLQKAEQGQCDLSIQDFMP